ncbi:MAG: glycerophosphodiester phosphodiesterase [Actinomycetota bacterium]
MPPRISAQRSEPLLFAHRGASADAPDNSIEAFRLAVEMGTTALESDVFASLDGQAVLSHDDNVGGLVRRQVITKSEVADLPDGIPSLRELFEAVGTGVSLSLDIKHPEAIGPTVDALRAVADDTGDNVVQRAWLCHPDFELICSWRSRWSDLRLVHSTRLDRVDGPERHASALFEAGIDAVNFRAPDWTGGLTTLYHKFGIYCFGWDAHLERVSAELLDMGCDAIFSNHVDRMLAARATVYGF